MSWFQLVCGEEPHAVLFQRISDMPMKDQPPSRHHNEIACSHLKSGAAGFSATDRMHPRECGSQMIPEQ